MDTTNSNREYMKKKFYLDNWYYDWDEYAYSYTHWNQRNWKKYRRHQWKIPRQ